MMDQDDGLVSTARKTRAYRLYTQLYGREAFARTNETC